MPFETRYTGRAMPITLDQFAHRILTTGSSEVGEPVPLEKLEREKTREVLVSFEEEFRLGLPDGLPEMNVSSAQWAMEALYRVCQLFVYRDHDVDSVLDSVRQSGPNPHDAKNQYSVFLIFRLLPSVVKRVSKVGADSPLHKVLQQWASEWPVACFYNPNLDEQWSPKVSCVDSIVQSSGLLDLFCEQIIQQRSLGSIIHPLIRIRILENLPPQDHWRDLITENAISNDNS